MIKELLNLILILLFGQTNTPKYDLKKQDNISPLNNLSKWAETWVLSHATLCLAILLIALMIAFIALAYAICGVSATGDTIYNGMGGVI